jgi:hypothetical protein
MLLSPLLASADQIQLQVFSLSSMPATTFNSLPDQAEIEIDGRKMTKRQFLMEMEQKSKMAIARKPPTPQLTQAQADAEFSTFRTGLLQGYGKRLEAENAVIRGNATNLGRTAQPPPAPDQCSTPKINAVSAAPPVEPGEELIINGCGFGPTGGELRLVGSFPGGYLKLSKLQWFPHAINARVPMVSGVKDHTAKLQVVTSDLKISNQWPMTFRATREVVRLVLNNIQVQCDVFNQYTKCPNYFPKFPTSTFGAFHGSPTAYHSGTDKASISLRNGYVLAGYGWWWLGSSFALDVPAGFTEGAASSVVNLHFTHWKDGFGEYGMAIYAVGPVGVPW